MCGRVFLSFIYCICLEGNSLRHSQPQFALKYATQSASKNIQYTHRYIHKYLYTCAYKCCKNIFQSFIVKGNRTDIF